MFIKSFQDIVPVLDRGVVVVFRNYSIWKGLGLLLLGKNNKERRYYKDTCNYEIWIGTNYFYYTRRRTHQRTTSLLEEQQCTLVHELIHAVNKNRGLEGSFGGFKSQSTGNILYYNRSYEIRIDVEAYRLIQDKTFLEKLICELSTRPNCCFVYEIDDTPFMEFHARAVGQLLPNFIPAS